MSGRLPVVGDPASVSRAGSVTAGSGARLAEQMSQVGAALAGLEPWVGSAARATRSRVTVLQTATRATAAELSTAGSLLQSHATALAAVLAELRALGARAEAAGLRIEDGRVVPALGLRGEAVADDEHDLRRLQESVGGELARLLREIRSGRTQLRNALTGSGARLADVAGDVRRGPATR